MATIYAKNKQTGEWERVGPAANATDSTLTLAGSPADAKATGEAIDNIQIRIENLTAEDVGALPSSTEIPSIEGLASEAYVNGRIDEKISEVVGSAPELLNTLDELSAALNDDENFATTVANQIATKQDKLTFDETPTADSTNPVTSGGIKSYVDESIILKDTEIKLPASSRWLSICYGNGKFVAVGNNRKAAYSTDGTTWHETSMPSYEKWAKVVCGEDKFVALSFSNIAYSTDGINWNSVTLPSTTNSSHSWSDLAYGNGVFVITARSSTGSNPTSDYAYSTDGINWTKSNLPDALSYPHIAYGNGKFITCSGGVISSDRIYCSEDGINWSYMTYASSINNRGISYVGDKFIIKTDSSGLENLYSTDGITWNTMSTGLNTTTYSPSYCYGNGMYVAVTSHSTTDRIQYNGIALYSADGITWTQTTMPFKCSSDVAYGNGKFVALHNYSDSYDVSTDTIMYSNDGINWRSGMSQLQTIGGENVTDDVLGALKHTHPEYETGGVQADLSQTDSTQPDYVNGIIRQESLPDGYPYKEGFSIEWNGDIVGKIKAVDYVAYKVSDAMPTNEQIKNATIDFVGNGTVSSIKVTDFASMAGINIDFWDYLVSNNYITDDVFCCVLDSLWFAVVRKENMVIDGVTFPETGTYFFYGDDTLYISGLSSETIYKIAPEYLPDGYPYKEKSESVLVAEQTLSCEIANGVSIAEEGPETIEEGKQYAVYINGNKSICTGAYMEGIGNYCGNIALFAKVMGMSESDAASMGFANTGENYLVCLTSNGVPNVVIDGEVSEITFAFSECSETIHPIAPEFLPEGYPYKEGVTIEWDGNTEGLETIAGSFYNIGSPISAEELVGAVVTFSNGSEIIITDDMIYNQENGVISVAGSFMVLDSDMVQDGETFSAGIYSPPTPYISRIEYYKAVTMDPMLLPKATFTEYGVVKAGTYVPSFYVNSAIISKEKMYAMLSESENGNIFFKWYIFPLFIRGVKNDDGSVILYAENNETFVFNITTSNGVECFSVNSFTITTRPSISFDQSGLHIYSINSDSTKLFTVTVDDNGILSSVNTEDYSTVEMASTQYVDTQLAIKQNTLTITDDGAGNVVIS